MAVPPAPRVWSFVAVVATALAGTGYYIYRVRAEAPAAVERVDARERSRISTRIHELRRQPHVAFRSLRPGADYGHLAFAGMDGLDERIATALPCNRIYFSTRAGVCLAVATKPAGFRAYLLDSLVAVTHTLDIPGTPSRARMSSDGRLAAYTVFVGADSYLAAGLSTRTRIVEADTGRELADLESFDVTRGGKPMRAVDFNFWGVTFRHDSSRFYATLGSAGRTYLVEGDLRTRTLTVVADDIECPSLSPDGTRIAFKKKFGSALSARWQPAILELSTRTIRLLPEPRHVDDQIEWLDDGHVLYAVTHSIGASQRRADVWKLATDGSNAPTLFIADAESPSVVRP
jgi:hypothetical protein